MIRRKPFRNKYGFIKIGTPVSFQVENQSMWGGELSGTLDYENGEYVIQTERSGTLKISGYLSVYWDSIRPTPS